MCKNFIPNKDNPWCGEHTARSILQLKSFTKSKMQIDSSTKPSSTKIELLASTKTSTNSVVSYPSLETRIISIVSCVALAFSMLTLYLHIRKSYLVKYRQQRNLIEQFEL